MPWKQGRQAVDLFYVVLFLVLLNILLFCYLS